jgi:hypothetical protein
VHARLWSRSGAPSRRMRRAAGRQARVQRIAPPAASRCGFLRATARRAPSCLRVRAPPPRARAPPPPSQPAAGSGKAQRPAARRTLAPQSRSPRAGWARAKTPAPRACGRPQPCARGLA